MKVTIDGVDYVPAPVIVSDGRTVAEVIAAARLVLGWTLEEAAGVVGCGISTLHDLEHKRRFPSFKLAAKIARAYGVPIHILAAAALNEE